MPKTKLGSMSVEQLLQLRDDVGKELNRKSTELQSQLARLGAHIAPSRGRGSSLKARRYRRSIVIRQATLGRVEGRNLNGWLPRLRKAKSWKILPL
jgi:hypothetical protein